MSNRHQELTSPEQTATGKDFSNPLIVDSLLKTIWLSCSMFSNAKMARLKANGLMTSYLHTRSYPTRLLTVVFMANLEFCDKHNMVAFLEKSTGSAGYSSDHSTLNKSHLAITTKKPERPTKVMTGPGGCFNFPTMIDVTAPSTSPSRITSSTSHSPEHSPSPTPSPSPEPTHAHTTADMMKTLKMIIPNRGGNYLMQRFKNKYVLTTKLFNSRSALNEVIQDQEGSEKASDEVSTTGAKKGTAHEEDPNYHNEISAPKKKSKKELEQERLSYAEAIRLEEQMDEEQRAQIARDEEIARQWDEEERKRAMDEAKSTKKIDWNDPSVIRYHSLKMKPKTIAQARRNMIKYLKNQGNFKISDFKGMSYNDIRPIFEKIWDFNQNIEPMDAEHGIKPMDSEHGSEIMKSPEKMKSAEKIEEEDVATQKEMKEVSKGSGAKRKKSIPRKSTRKRQKMEEDAEKEELKGFLDIIPREEVPIEVESLSTKFPIVDWKTYVLTKNFMYYQIVKGDGSSKNYKILSEMLEDFDRQDVEELYRLVKERYSTSRPEGYDLMLWGDLHTLFEPDEEDELWKNQHEYNVISWSLYDFCGIHILLMQNGIAIHMLTEKKYPLSQEMISKMLKKKLEVDHESSQAFELLRFIRSQVQK
ncbi:hypothetical protein Tco_0599989 [Tanacetum coccineum]|uniref:Uncharacterized protein n=1 Tax=Tanacetum coccineum TaxID=301880 RepID=A0ABQ4WAL2_9ASTR